MDHMFPDDGDDAPVADLPPAADDEFCPLTHPEHLFPRIDGAGP